MSRRWILLLILFVLAATGERALARIRQVWSEQQIADKADLIVIVKAIEVRDTGVKTTIPDVRRGNDLIAAVEMETTFEVSAVLKGKLENSRLVFCHLREEKKEVASRGGAELVAFDPGEKKQYLLFLKREADGRHSAVVGQTDPADAVREMNRPTAGGPKAAVDKPGEARAAFDAAYLQWQKECERIKFSSRTGDYIALGGFRAIVAMGPEALPFLQEKMEAGKGLDFMLASAAVEIKGWKRADFVGAQGEQNYCARVLAKLKGAAAPEGHVEWIARAMREMQGLKTGMSRGELLKVVSEEGGLSTRTARRYAFRECPYIKVNVEFRAVGEPDDAVGMASSNDEITRVSPPFLEWAIMD